MGNVSVSVIIPVYDVEKYLKRCVESVRSQTLSNIEIILVDDGSPDLCPQMCDNYADRDGRIKVIHKKNGGLASARNAGMKMAGGKYIFFVDSDDWIDPTALYELFRIAEEENVDFVRYRPMYAGWPEHKDGELCDFGTEGGLKEKRYDREAIIESIFPRLIATEQLTMGPIVSACRSLYRRDFLEEREILFDEEVKYSEDSVFSARVVYAADSFYYLDGARYYHYFYNSASITKSFRSDRWDSCKKLVCTFEKYFGTCTDYNFQVQIQLKKIFCVLQALSQRKLLKTVSEKEQYCSEICSDPLTVEALRNLRMVRVSFKLYVFLLLIKFRCSFILARI